MKKLIVAAAALAVAVIGGATFGLSTPAAHADPSNVWVINNNVGAGLSGALGLTTPFACTAAGVDQTSANLDTLAAASAAQLTFSDSPAGGECLVIKTDGSTSAITVNPRGATVGTTTPAAAAGTNGTFAETTIDNGAIATPSTFVSGSKVTVTQDAVALDSAALKTAGIAHDMTLTASKATVQEGATACGITASQSAPTNGLATVVYTDINGTQLVGYHPTVGTSAVATLAIGNATGLTTASQPLVTIMNADGTVGAEDAYCGIKAGTANVTATSATGEITGVTGACNDEGGNTDCLTRTSAITVTGVPANVALTASPSAIACDGTATSTVTATVTDSAGNNVVDGTPVTFQVVALGTANPINATTTGGTASSVITPLAGSTSGVVVTVTAGTAAAQIRIDCQASLLTPTAPAGPTATATPKGGVVGPNTGTGGYLGSSSSTGFPMWALAALALASVVLVGGGVVVRRTGK